MFPKRMPSTALAATSAKEKPACPFKVALLPARPPFLLMYTKGQTSQDIMVKYRYADTNPVAARGGCLLVASFKPTMSKSTT
jgi:hypothetical protein